MNQRHSRSGGERSVRVAEQIHQELAKLIALELADPKTGLITLTGAEVTPDYAYATIYYTVFPSTPDRVVRSLEHLRRSSRFLRHMLGQKIRIHTLPELRFVHDTSVERGVGLSRLIDEANAIRAADDDAGSAPKRAAGGEGGTGGTGGAGGAGSEGRG
jgi:ribosome-binding factor A